MFNQNRIVFLLAVLVAACFVPSSLVHADPVLDGNIDDVISLANQSIANGTGAGIIITDPARDICLGDTFLPCEGVLHTGLNGCRCYDNGFDIALVAMAVVGDQAWIGMRVYNGNIGDTDGDGTDSSGVDCPTRESGYTVEDPSGIGDGEHYQFKLDTNCDGVTDIIVAVHGGAGGLAPVVHVTDGGGVTPKPVTSAEAEFAGTDLEIHIQGLALPSVFSLNARAESVFSGMTADACGPVKNNAPVVSLRLDSQVSPESFGLGQPKWVTLLLTNTSLVPAYLSMRDVLPSDWQFTGNWSGDLPLGSAVGRLLTFTSHEVAPDSTASVRFEVVTQRGDVSEENRAVADAYYEVGCLMEPLTALSDTARAEWVANTDTSTVSANLAEPRSLLGPASPNPFRASTRIAFTLGGSETGRVRVALYDVSGRLVRTLIDGSRAPGRYDLVWDGRREDGSVASGGVYFARAWLGERPLAISRRVLYVR